MANVVPLYGLVLPGMYLPVSKYASVISSYNYNPIALGFTCVLLSCIYKAVNTYSIFIYTCTEAAIPCIGAGIYAVQGDDSVWT